MNCWYLGGENPDYNIHLNFFERAGPMDLSLPIDLSIVYSRTISLSEICEINYA